ncbi:MAG TPA: hypothetical protein VLS92_10090, partial [Acidimicrobiia bacterium]|nr:hypothetical protein [Acidimicrobiia bacterium]
MSGDEVRESAELAQRAASWSGRELSPEQLELLTRYADWLRLEAIPAGGLGPREGERVWSRHLADS